MSLRAEAIKAVYAWRQYGGEQTPLVEAGLLLERMSLASAVYHANQSLALLVAIGTEEDAANNGGAVIAFPNHRSSQPAASSKTVTPSESVPGRGGAAGSDNRRERP